MYKAISRYLLTCLFNSISNFCCLTDIPVGIYSRLSVRLIIIISRWGARAHIESNITVLVIFSHHLGHNNLAEAIFRLLLKRSDAFLVPYGSKLWNYDSWHLPLSMINIPRRQLPQSSLLHFGMHRIDNFYVRHRFNDAE